MEAKHIAKKLEIAGRLECVVEKPAYITLKDYKENFNTNSKYHLINSAKSELSNVVKTIAENINKSIRDKLHCNLWKNASNVIDWFQNITDKGKYIFLQFDIEEIYP